MNNFIQKMGEKLVAKYLDKVKLTCENIEIGHLDDPDFDHEFRGRNCRMVAGDYEFDFNRVKTQGNITNLDKFK